MRTAVLIPCYNEEKTVARVVNEFRDALPGADIYVYDNNSTDRTSEAARNAGAIVRFEQQPGKGSVMRRMFADIDADVYVLADGDATYHAPSASKMIHSLTNMQLDMVVGYRLHSEDKQAFRAGHHIGNRLLTKTVALIFGRGFTDMLSGYRVFSRRFVKSFPAVSSGFEIETELTIHALSLRLPVVEMEAPYGARPEGSVSKLSTWQDGWRILLTILQLFKNERPLAFFALIAASLAVVALGLGTPVIETYIQTGLVPRLPTAVLCTGLMVLACLGLVCGLVLDGVTTSRRENRRLAYLACSTYSRG